ncbi:hypothetical protein MNBD_ALPHA02-90 [hydrothermal vent metagenome]|uniref:Ribbon-helix-helix protein CopG domain-containing protein n=1 Tax=hydrothermal vent metagenome TaxID=652676 RepID=A0A3B0RP30_9ZZZZ
MKLRINVYLDYDLHNRVERFKAKTGLSKSGIMEIAVAQFLSPESADKREACLIWCAVHYDCARTGSSLVKSGAVRRWIC